MSDIRWKTTDTCSHMNGDVCQFCDFDRFYARSYAGCPWARS